MKVPIKIQNDLPVKEILEDENLFLVDELRASHQDIRPLQICILNLMPIKEDTELQLLRMLSNTPLQLEITFMRVSSHKAVHTSYNHLHKFYYAFSELKERYFDGLIITGAPVEKLPFEEVDYWPELCEIMEWSKTHVQSTFHICWAAQAGVYYHYGLQKQLLPKKLCGVYRHKVFHRREPLVRGFDDYFLIPHSRYTEVPSTAIHACGALKVLAESDEAGVLLCIAHGGRQVFIFGHGEYDRYTLAKEYERDVKAGLNPDLPKNYYPDDDPAKTPLLLWRSAAQMVYSNWINYYVYQETPYDISKIREQSYE